MVEHEEILKVLRMLHNNREKPRLEIPGAGEPSIEALYLNWFNNAKNSEPSVYVIADWYEDTSYVTEFNTECIKLPKAGIESLVEYALSTNMGAEVYAKGLRIKHNERWDDYCGEHKGAPEEVTDVLVKLSLEKLQGNWRFNALELPFLAYPADFPKLAIANRLPLCINCQHVWLEPFGGREPDSNHCVGMDMTREACEKLNPEQHRKLDELLTEGVLCPVFEQTARYSK